MALLPGCPVAGALCPRRARPHDVHPTAHYHQLPGEDYVLHVESAVRGSAAVGDTDGGRTCVLHGLCRARGADGVGEGPARALPSQAR